MLNDSIAFMCIYYEFKMEKDNPWLQYVSYSRETTFSEFI